MKLASHSLHAYRLPYARPVKWSDIVEEGAEFLLLQLVSDTGHEGVAELTFKPTWNGATTRSARAALEDMFLPMLSKLDISDPAAVRAKLEIVPQNHAAKAIVDNALWDLHANATGRALWKQWGGKQKVDLSFTVTRAAPAAMAAEAVAMIEKHGFGTLKIKGGQSQEIDVAALRELKSAVATSTGRQVRFYVDSNGAYGIDKAGDYVKAMADAGAEVVEDPCLLHADDAFASLQNNSTTPVLIDFANWSARDTQRFIDRGARAFSLKPGRFGLSDTRAMQQVCEQADCINAVGMFGESALGTLTALQLASTLPSNALPAEVSWFLSMTAQVTNAPLIVENGSVDLLDAAGSASLIDWERVRRFAM